MLNIKQQLYDYCHRFLSQRISAVEEAIRAAQLSANAEDKSSAGDKYETGRAMMQLDIEQNSVQLAEARRLKSILDQIKIDKHSLTIQPGNLAITSEGNFFVAISVGKVVIEDKTYLVVSPESPVGSKLLGLKAGKSFSFNRKTYNIAQVW